MLIFLHRLIGLNWFELVVRLISSTNWFKPAIDPVLLDCADDSSLVNSPP